MANENFMQMQMFEQQIKQLQKYLETFDEQLVEIRNLMDSLKEIGHLKKGETFLAPVANGIFMKAKIDNPQELLINVGSNTVAVKSIADAIKMLEGQEGELNKYRAETLSNLEQVLKQLEGLQE